MAEQPLDLAHTAVTVRLLERGSWRVRAVERLEVDSAFLYRRRRSLQCGPLREVLSEDPSLLQEPALADPARVVLPVALLPKGPLLDLDIRGPDGATGHLLVRSSIAEVETEFVLRAARDAGIPELSSDARRVMVELIALSEGPWRATDRPYRSLERRQRTYLADEVDTNHLPVVLTQLRALSRR